MTKVIAEDIIIQAKLIIASGEGACLILPVLTTEQRDRMTARLGARKGMTIINADSGETEVIEKDGGGWHKSANVATMEGIKAVNDQREADTQSRFEIDEGEATEHRASAESHHRKTDSTEEILTGRFGKEFLKIRHGKILKGAEGGDVNPIEIDPPAYSRLSTKDFMANPADGDLDNPEGINDGGYTSLRRTAVGKATGKYARVKLPGGHLIKQFRNYGSLNNQYNLDSPNGAIWFLEYLGADDSWHVWISFMHHPRAEWSNWKRLPVVLAFEVRLVLENMNDSIESHMVELEVKF